MFGKLRDKLKGWFKSSKEKIEEKIEVVEAEEEIEEKIEEVEEKGLETEEAREIEAEKADEIIEEAKKEEIPEAPVKFEVGKQKFEPDLEQIKEERPSLLSKVKSRFTHKISEEEFNEIFDDLEMLLLENNVALEAVDEIRKSLGENLIGREIKRDKLEEEIKNELKKTLNEILIEPDNPLDIIKISEKPFKILFFGINGTGKTTSIAKVANFLKKAGFSVVLAAGDTFRAASIEQISEHAEKLGVKLIKQDYGTDPAAVGFDAVKYAEKHKIDVVLIDTAGRMHTKSNLLSEMEKIARVTKPNLKIFVAESIAGNDAVEQAKTFHNEIGMDGMILTKADIDEKGGTVISVSHATGKPIFYLGVGQGYDDLELFNKQKFIDGLLG